MNPSGPHPDAPKPGDAGSIEPAPTGSPAAVAAELVVHGLLLFTHGDDVAGRERRVSSVLGQIPGATSLSPPPRTLRFPSQRAARRWLAAAAILAIGITLFILGVPGESSALAEVRQSIVAMRAAGDRRYEITLSSWADDRAAAEPNAILDTRSRGEATAGLVLIRHRPPGSAGFAFGGRDDTGPWAIRSDGSVERDNPQRLWPPFITDGGESLMVASMDHVLEQLPATCKLSRSARAAIEGGDGRSFDRITADRNRRDGPLPNHIELWIDPATRLVERIEYRWDSPQPAGAGGPHGPGGPGDGNLLGGERDGGGPPPDHAHDGPGGPPPGDRPPPPPHDHGPGGFDGGPPDRGGDGPPPPPPPPPGDRRPHDRGPSGPAGGPHGPDGPGGPDGGGDPGRRRGGGRPRLVVFQRVDAPALPNDWFTPEGHGTTK